MSQRKCTLFLIILLPLYMLPLMFQTSSSTAGDAASAIEEFGDLSEKEHCISNLMLSYTKRDIEKFSELLHADYKYYGFGNTIEWNAQEEREKTAMLFTNAIVLSIEIELDSWTKTHEIFGSPCVNCWESTRKYALIGQTSEDANVISGTGYTKFIVTQDEENGKSKYRILAIIDLGRELPK
jgi:hypothetical protein